MKGDSRAAFMSYIVETSFLFVEQKKIDINGGIDVISANILQPLN